MNPPNTKENVTRQVTQPDRLKQLLLVSFIIIPQFILLSTNPNTLVLISQWYHTTVTNILNLQFNNQLFWFCVFLLSIERISYTFVWLFPQKFIKLCYHASWRYFFTSQQCSPIKMFEKLFYLNKCFLFISYFLFYVNYSQTPVFDVFDLTQTFSVFLRNVTVWQWVTFTQTLLIGCVLNASIYGAIGKKGVYYGVKLGYHIPWCDGFPFNVIGSHPQYVGAALNVIGTTILIANQDIVENGWFVLGICQLILYVYLAIVEQYF